MRQSDYGRDRSIALAEEYHTQRGTTDHVAYPAVPPADAHGSRRGTSDHAAYPAIAGRHSRRQTADQSTEGISLPRYAPYPSMASPEDPQHSGSHQKQSRRVTQQQGAAAEPGDLPRDGRRTRRTTDDGTEDRRADMDRGSARPSYNGEADPAQHAAPSGNHERWGTDAAVTVSYPNAGKNMSNLRSGVSPPQSIACHWQNLMSASAVSMREPHCICHKCHGMLLFRGSSTACLTSCWNLAW